MLDSNFALIEALLVYLPVLFHVPRPLRFELEMGANSDPCLVDVLVHVLNSDAY